MTEYVAKSCFDCPLFADPYCGLDPLLRSIKVTVSQPSWIKDGVVKGWKVSRDPNFQAPDWCPLRVAPVTIRLSSGEG